MWPLRGTERGSLGWGLCRCPQRGYGLDCVTSIRKEKLDFPSPFPAPKQGRMQSRLASTLFYLGVTLNSGPPASTSFVLGLQACTSAAGFCSFRVWGLGVMCTYRVQRSALGATAQNCPLCVLIDLPPGPGLGRLAGQPSARASPGTDPARAAPSLLLAQTQGLTLGSAHD